MTLPRKLFLAARAICRLVRSLPAYWRLTQRLFLWHGFKADSELLKTDPMLSKEYGKVHSYVFEGIEEEHSE